MKLDMRTKEGKLKGVWDAESNTVIIRGSIERKKIDYAFTLTPDGNLLVKEIPVTE